MKQKKIKLSKKDGEVLYEGINTPPVPNTALIKAAKLTKENLAPVKDFNQLLDLKYGKKGTTSRVKFEARSKSFYISTMIGARREELKMSKKELADKTGLKVNFITRIENGDFDIRLSTLIRLLSGLGIAYEKILEVHE